jgi:phosphoheptose isomerase
MTILLVITSVRLNRTLVTKHIDNAVEKTVQAFHEVFTLRTNGNAGSALDSLHIAGKLRGRFLIELKLIKCIFLATNSANLTTLGNDYVYESVFSRNRGICGVRWCVDGHLNFRQFP